MAAGASVYLQNKILDHCMGKAAYTMPATVYLALIVTTLPTASMTGSTITEPAGGNGYARIQISASALTSAASGLSTNGTTITFASATNAGWGTIIGFAICDALTLGNMLFYGTLTNKTILAGDTASLNGGAPGDLQITAT
jgi:hypothetical protein